MSMLTLCQKPYSSEYKVLRNDDWWMKCVTTCTCWETPVTASK